MDIDKGSSRCHHGSLELLNYHQVEFIRVSGHNDMDIGLSLDGIMAYNDVLTPLVC